MMSSCAATGAACNSASSGAQERFARRGPRGSRRQKFPWLNAAGFADVARISNAPLVATHSNAHAVSPHARNLTDDQLAAIARSGGVVGLNFECSFLRPDGRPDTDTPPEVALAHLDHLLNALGEEGVALGSDFDGCRPPVWLNSADKLGALVAAMAAHGYDAARIERICWGNWMRVLKETWGA